MASFRQHSADAETRLKSEWADAVRRDRDHPCIVVWVPMNESDGLGENPATFLETLYRMTKELDPTRPVVSNDGWQHATTDLCTLHDYSSAPELAQRYRALDSTLEPSSRVLPPYLPGYSYRGEPVIVSEFGGVALTGAGGWHYSEAAGPTGLLETYRQMVHGLMEAGPVEGFCYTQLCDVQQEMNGLLTAERLPKIDPDLVRPVTQTAKRR
jgi:hypothetical protein